MQDWFYLFIYFFIITSSFACRGGQNLPDPTNRAAPIRADFRPFFAGTG
jgi:hypothetical protein